MYICISAIFQRLRHFPRPCETNDFVGERSATPKQRKIIDSQGRKLVSSQEGIDSYQKSPPSPRCCVEILFGGGIQANPLPPKKTMMCSSSVFCWMNMQTSCASFVLVSSFKQIVGLHIMGKISWTSKSIRKGSHPRFYRSRCCFWKSSCANKWSTQKIILFLPSIILGGY